MKILLVNCYSLEDYQSDTCMHGLRTLLGSDLVDYPRMNHMYTDADKAALYGRGFSMFGLLDNKDIDRDDIQSKIKNRFFDLVIIGDVYRWDREFLLRNVEYISQYYEPNKLVFIDGQDACARSNGFHYIISELLSKGIYFKREIYRDEDVELSRVIPISFGIPKEKITPWNDIVNSTKLYDFAPLIPSNLRKDTYVYNDEESYYDMYRQSYFGYTCFKGGADCIRHLEIMACGVVPFFLDVENVPKYTMAHYPKKEFIEAKKIPGVFPAIKGGYNHFITTLVKNPLWQDYFNRGIAADMVLPERGRIDLDIFDLSRYNEIRELIYNHLCTHLTTEAAAKRVLDEVTKRGNS